MTMNKFENQIAKSAKTLRDKQEATLTVPSPPKVNRQNKNIQLKWWISIAAAISFGYLLGDITAMNYPQNFSSPTMIAKVSTIRDTIFTTIYDTLILKQEIPIYIPTSEEKNLASATNDTDTYNSSTDSTSTNLQEQTLPADQLIGKNILDDTIHYALLITM